MSFDGVPQIKSGEEAGDIDIDAEMLSESDIFKFLGDILLEAGLKALVK
jgi:hypothetical protein